MKTVTVGHTSLCLSHFEGEYGALSNHCPHQGGPLGEGSIENGWLRCPWHGYDYHRTISGQVPSPNLGRGAFQDLDLAGAFDDVAANSATVIAGSDPAELMTLACKHALVERNVGHLILPDEVQVATSDTQAGGPAGRVGIPAHDLTCQVTLHRPHDPKIG